MPRIIFVFSDTGGGHRAAAEAIITALHAQFSGRYETVMFDGFKASVWPLSLAPVTYRPTVTYTPWLWAASFRTTNNVPMIGLMDRGLYLFQGRAMQEALAREQPDLVVSVHPLFTYTIRRALARTGRKPPFVTIVTDLIDGHQAWFDGQPDLCIVPSDHTCQLALGFGLPRERVRVIGLPVSLKFVEASSVTQAEARAQLGLDPNLPTVLAVGGGEGMGPLYGIARAIADLKRPLQLVVIAGRNPHLQRRLEQTDWDMPVRVTGFVTNMPDWMRAADLIVTKAGPGTIMEALACELPILLSGYLPGQEAGNAEFVVKEGVGTLVRDPSRIAATVADWLGPNRAALDRMKARARELARPRAALDIAAELDRMLSENTAGSARQHPEAHG